MMIWTLLDMTATKKIWTLFQERQRIKETGTKSTLKKMEKKVNKVKDRRNATHQRLELLKVTGEV